MQNLKSPLNSQEFEKIDIFLKSKSKDLLNMNTEIYNNLKNFKENILDFDSYLVDLTDSEKTRAWFYLYSSTKKMRNDSLKASKSKNNNQIGGVNAISGVTKVGATIALIGIALIIYFSFFGKGDYEKCVDRGMAYYKDIGSYPRLKTEDISTESKVRENCSRSKYAFGDFN